MIAVLPFVKVCSHGKSLVKDQRPNPPESKAIILLAIGMCVLRKSFLPSIKHGRKLQWQKNYTASVRKQKTLSRSFSRDIKITTSIQPASLVARQENCY